MATDHLAPAPTTTHVVRGLLKPSFLCLVFTQFFGSITDNFFRWFAVFYGAYLLGGDAKTLALCVGAICLTVPYLLLAMHAGYLADRFSKRSVIVACKVAEIGIALLGIAALYLHSVPLMFVVITLLGVHGALYAPSKSGAIPEILPAEEISAGNGLMGLMTIVAVAVGTMSGRYVGEMVTPETGPVLTNLWLPASILLGVAVTGLVLSLGIQPLPASDPRRPFPLNPVTGVRHELSQLFLNRPLLRAALGIAFFWGLASLANLNVPLFAEELHIPTSQATILMGILVAGVGTGSIVAGLWSGGKVELGIVPLGAVGIVLASLWLFVSAWAPTPGWAMTLSAIGLFALGGSAGFFNIPLDSYLQHRSPPETRGNILAASNFLTFSGIIVCTGVFYVLMHILQLSPRALFLLTGLLTIPVIPYAFKLLPEATIRCIVMIMSVCVYRLRVYGRENVPAKGGALLVANHVSWIDGVLLLLVSSRRMRIIAHADNVTTGFAGWLSRIYGVIPIRPNEGPKALVKSLLAARQSVIDGELVLIFAEGALTRTGQLQPFQRGMMKIVEGTGAPVIPVYLDGFWGSIFSFRDGRFFTKWPRQWPYPLSIHFGKPVQDADNVFTVRQAVQNLGMEAMEKRKERHITLPRIFISKARKAMFQPKLADSIGVEVTGGQLLLRTLVLRRILSRLLARDENMVGVLLPPAVASFMVNAGLMLLRRVTVNLNYTVSATTLEECCQQAGLRHVITSRRFLDKTKIDIKTPAIFMEDLPSKATIWDKFVAALQAYCVPRVILDRWLGLTKIKPDDLATIIFTSGSTGEPKGVKLSMFNVASNVDAFDHLIQLKSHDCMLGILPFFHSFGYTVTFGAPMMLDTRAAYHNNPLDAKVVESLAEKHKATILLSTPTFLRTYLKRVEPESFKTLDLVVVGAEKLPRDLAQAFEEKFKIKPLEGYGTTELSPVASVNVPDHRTPTYVQLGSKDGSVGRPIPGCSAKVIDPETERELGPDEPGLLLIKGPNVMQGYLNKPELTAKVMRDGWYVTGDIAKIDTDGFIFITDRQSRFSKIGGEMVPHIQVEQTLQKILATEGDDQELKAVVTSVPCERKGERLIVVHKPFCKPFDEIVQSMNGSGLPNLWIPSRDSFMEVSEFPVLGTGKLDLKGMKSLALARFVEPKEPAAGTT